MKKTLSVLTVLSLILLCMLSCGEEHAIKRQVQKTVDEMCEKNGVDMKIKKFDNFYGCVWKPDGNAEKTITDKYGKKKYDEIESASMKLVALSVAGHKTDNSVSLKMEAAEIDRILKDCGITPTSYFTRCSVEMEDPVSGEKAGCVIAMVGNSEHVGYIIDDSSFR